MVDAGVVERSIVVSGLPEDASESEIVIHFQKRKNGGGDIDEIIWKEKRDTVLIVFADPEDAKSVLKTKQYFRDNLQLVVSPVPVEENEMKEDNDDTLEEMRIFESVSGILDPSLFEGLTQSEVTCIMEKVQQSALVQWTPSAVGLLSTGTIKQLEVVRDILGREVMLVRVREKDQFPIKNHPSGYKSAENETGAVAYASKINHQREIEDDYELPSRPVLKKFYINPDVSENTAVQNSRQTLHDFSGKTLDKSPAALPLSSVTFEETGKNYVVAAFESSTCPPKHARKERQKSRGVKSGHENRRAATTKINGDEFQFVANLPNMVTVQVLEGDLTNHLPADVIVNPSNQHLQNTCGIGASIIDRGGLSIQIELNDILGERHTYPPDQIIQTRAGSLPYKNIFHAVCPPWEYVLKDKYSKVLHTVCLKSLNEFSATQMKTIAFPSFSCSDSFPLPEDTCAQVMLNAVTVFAEEREPLASKPIDVHFVIDNEETLMAFQSELKKLLNADKKQKTMFYKDTFVENETRDFETERNKKYIAERNSSATKHSNESEEMSNKCPVCLENIKQPKTLDKCQHTFCTTCVESAFQVKKICPLCKVSYAMITGSQPDGKMSFRRESRGLPGFNECGTIVITYHFKGGVQGACHPNPGQRYSGTTRDAYLPDNREGNEVLAMFQKAFDHRLIFKIGTSLSSHARNQITWSDIPQKSDRYGGERNFGYPDAGYLMRVKEQLTEKGIYP